VKAYATTAAAPGRPTCASPLTPASTSIWPAAVVKVTDGPPLITCGSASNRAPAVTWFVRPTR
jgi:hypothetical protein